MFGSLFDYIIDRFSLCLEGAVNTYILTPQQLCHRLLLSSVPAGDRTACSYFMLPEKMKSFSFFFP